MQKNFNYNNRIKIRGATYSSMFGCVFAASFTRCDLFLHV